MRHTPLCTLSFSLNVQIFTILVVCRSRGYGLFVSLDDDILLSPAALAAMVAASDDASADLALRPHSEGGLGCSMVAPTLSTGIPTVPAFEALSLSLISLSLISLSPLSLNLHDSRDAVPLLL